MITEIKVKEKKEESNRLQLQNTSNKYLNKYRKYQTDRNHTNKNIKQENEELYCFCRRNIQAEMIGCEDEEVKRINI